MNSIKLFLVVCTFSLSLQTYTMQDNEPVLPESVERSDGKDDNKKSIDLRHLAWVSRNYERAYHATQYGPLPHVFDDYNANNDDQVNNQNDF